jgi:hypothetical protein
MLLQLLHHHEVAEDIEVAEDEADEVEAVVEVQPEAE